MDLALLLGYGGVVLCAPLVRPELLVCAIFFIGTHGLAGGASAWGGLAAALALTVSAAYRLRPSAAGSRSTPAPHARWSPALRQPVGVLAGTLVLLLAASAVWAPDVDLALRKLGDFVFRLVLPVAVVLVLTRRGRFDSSFALRWAFRFAIGIAGASLLLAMVNSIALGGGGRLRFIGLHPLALAQACAVGCLLALVHRLLGVARTEALLGGGVCLCVLVLTGSKGPLLALAAAFGCALLSDANAGDRRVHLLRDARRWMLAVVGMLVILVLAGVSIVDRIPARLRPSFYSGEAGARRSQSLSARELLWREAWERGWESPVIGNGLASSYRSQVRDVFTGDQLAVYPHNLLLEVFSETGVVAAVLVVLLVAVLARRVLRLPAALAFLVLAVFTAAVTGGLADHRLVLLFVVAVGIYAEPVVTAPGRPPAHATLAPSGAVRAARSGGPTG